MTFAKKIRRDRASDRFLAAVHLPPTAESRMTRAMTSKVPRTAGKAAVAIGSAAIAAALLYSSRRKDRREKDKPAPPHTPTGEPPQTD